MRGIISNVIEEHAFIPVLEDHFTTGSDIDDAIRALISVKNRAEYQCDHVTDALLSERTAEDGHTFWVVYLRTKAQGT